jgi:hypothetical protein
MADMDDSYGNNSPTPTLPSQVYEATARRLFEEAPVEACRLLGLPLTQPPQVLPSALRDGPISTDVLLLRVAPNRLAHLYCVHRISDQEHASEELIQQLMIDRALIMLAYPEDRLSQHVIVLGEGTVRGHDEPARRGFSLKLNIVYVRDLDPEVLLGSANLAPLSVLGDHAG